MSSSPAPTRPTPTPAAPAPDLTVNKVLAGAGAAATAAVLGSFFGAAGTVLGAALGSIASTIATAIYQRSLDRTQKTIAARFRPGTGDDETPAGEDTVVIRPVPPPRRRPRWGVWIGATALVFAVGLGAVTGIEWVKGSSLTTGQSGTSVSRVLTPSDGSGDAGQSATPATSETATPTTDPAADSTREATSAPTTSPQPTSTVAPTSAAVPGLNDLPDGSP